MKNLSQLEKKLELKFKDKNFIIQAITHRSYLNEHPEFKLEHNERLEFLGDAVLELIVTEHLYNNYPNPEGELTNWRASLVNRSSLATIAEELNIGPHILMSKGEARDKNPKARQYILSNAVEAIIGAIYLDQGLKETKKFIERKVISKLKEILEKKLYIDAKSKFQEESQEREGITPSYKVLNSSGPDHKKTFEVGVFLAKKLVAKGKGTSKQEAQTEAARAALKQKNWN